MPQYTTRLLCSRHELDAIADRWNELHRRQERPALQLHPDWLPLEVRSKPGASVAVIALYDGPELVGVAPFLIRPWRWQCRLAYAHLASFPVRLADLCGESFIAPDDPEAHQALVSAMGERNFACDMIYLEDLPVGSQLWRILDEHRPASAKFWQYTPAKCHSHWLIRLAPTFEAYLANFSSKRRCKLRNDNRRLEKHAKAPIRVERITAPEQIPAFLAHVERVSAVSWQGTRLEQIVHDTLAEREKLAAHARRGWIRSYLLLSGDTCVAFVMGTQAGGVYCYDRIGYDPAWASYRPGTVLLYHILEDLHAHRRPDWLDFGSGDAEYKRFYGNETYEAVNMYLLRPSFYMGIARATKWSLDALDDVARRSVQRFGLRTQVVRWLRRGSPAAGEPPAAAVE